MIIVLVCLHPPCNFAIVDIRGLNKLEKGGLTIYSTLTICGLFPKGGVTVPRSNFTLLKALSIAAVLLAIMFITFGCATIGSESGPELTPASAHPKAPDVAFRHMDGTTTTLTDYSGESVVLINFWGLRCQNCIEEMPFLERLHNKYGNKGLLILGVNTDGVDEKLLPRFLPQLPVSVTYGYVVDPEFVLADSFQMMAAPLSVLVAKDGTIRYRHEGYQPEIEAGFVKIIEELLAE